MTTQALAHAYGEMTLISGCGSYKEIPDVLNSGNNYEYYCRREQDRQEFAYRFNEYNPNDTQLLYPLFTNRIVTASAGECFHYSQVGESRIGPEMINFEYANESFSGNISIPKQSDGSSGTTYIYRGTEVPQNETEYSCGPRCLWMWAHKSQGQGESSTFIQCPITISSVSYTTRDTEILSDDLARLAASSIALQGRWTGNDSDHPSWTQYQFYPFGQVESLFHLK